VGQCRSILATLEYLGLTPQDSFRSYHECSSNQPPE
jgi:hypothetical protein